MGLDITAHRKISLLDLAPNDDACEHGGFRVFNAAGFASRASDLITDAAYSSAEQMSFSLSYGGYNDWRETLARLAGYSAAPDSDDDRHAHSAGAWQARGGPFWELINYSDCEGVIGTAVSTKLAKDFADHEEGIKAATTDVFFHKRYDLFRAAFEMATDGGCVEFH